MKDKLKQEGKNQNPLFSIQSAKDSLANFIACKLGVSVVELKKVERWVRTDDKSFTDNGGGEKSGIIFEINLESQGNVRFALITESLLDEIATEIRDTAEIVGTHPAKRLFFSVWWLRREKITVRTK